MLRSEPRIRGGGVARLFFEKAVEAYPGMAKKLSGIYAVVVPVAVVFVILWCICIGCLVKKLEKDKQAN